MDTVVVVHLIMDTHKLLQVLLKQEQVYLVEEQLNLDMFQELMRVDVVHHQQQVKMDMFLSQVQVLLHNPQQSYLMHLQQLQHQQQVVS